MRTRIILTIFSLICITVTGLAQDQEEDKKPRSDFRDRLVFGGGVTLTFTNQQTAIGAAPLIGYRVSDRYTAGVSVNYLYQSFGRTVVNSYGGGIFNRFAVTEELFLHSEFEHLTFTYPNSITGEGRQSFNIPFLLVGGGYRQPLGGNAGIGVTVLYDLIQDPNSPYPENVVIRGGVSVGF